MARDTLSCPNRVGAVGTCVAIAHSPNQTSRREDAQWAVLVFGGAAVLQSASASLHVERGKHTPERTTTSGGGDASRLHAVCATNPCLRHSFQKCTSASPEYVTPSRTAQVSLHRICRNQTSRTVLHVHGVWRCKRPRVPQFLRLCVARRRPFCQASSRLAMR